MSTEAARAREALIRHLETTRLALGSLEEHTDQIDSWAEHLTGRLLDGGRLLVAGNGGSAAEAQHLTGELLGRYADDRRPLGALALHGDTSAVTGIANDYGCDEVFARQVRGHGRSGDVLLVLSTSGRSSNVLRAVETAAETGLTTWALTGPRPNELADRVDEALAVEGETTAAVQEAHLVAIHLLCSRLDDLLPPADDERDGPVREALRS